MGFFCFIINYINYNKNNFHLIFDNFAELECKSNLYEHKLITDFTDFLLKLYLDVIFQLIIVKIFVPTF